MKIERKLLCCALPAVAFSLLHLCACGGGSGGGSVTPPPPPVASVSFQSAPPNSMNIGTMASLNVVVSNASNSDVTWAVTCGSSDCGTFGWSAPPQNTIGFIAPNTIPAGKTVTVKATLSADTTKFVSATITVTAKIAFSGYVPTYLQAGRTGFFSAFVTGQSISPEAQMQWSSTCSSSDCGSFNPTITSNVGVAGTAFTAPATVPTGGSVTVTATSLADPAQTVSTPVTVVTPTPALPNGSYVFQISQPFGAVNSFTTGVFVAKDGQIIDGEQDSNSYATETTVNGYATWFATPVYSKIASGTYDSLPDGNFEIDLNYTLANGGFGTSVLRGVLNPSAQGFTAQIYGLGGSGILQMQSSTAAPSGGYAISLRGGDLSYQSMVWWGGILNFDGASQISGSGSILDLVEYHGVNSPLLEAQPVGISSVSAPDSYGRFQINLAPGSSARFLPVNLVGYVIDGSHILLTETGGDSYQGVLGGIGIAQGASTGRFSSSSLTGTSYVFGASGLDLHASSTTWGQAAGVLNLQSGGALTAKVTWNSPLLNRSLVQCTGSWTVDSTGRVAVTNFTDNSAIHTGLYFYLTGDGNGLVLSRDVWLAGQMYQRMSNTFSSSSFNGTYGFQGGDLRNPLGYAVYGSLTANAGSSTTAVSGFSDSDLAPNFPVSGSFTNSTDGILTGTMTGFDVKTPTAAAPYIVYLIDDHRAIAVESANTALEMESLEKLP